MYNNQNDSPNGDDDVKQFETTGSPFIKTPYLNIDPSYLNPADDYIFLEDAGPIRSRFQTMCSMIGSSTVVGGVLGGAQSLRYSGLKWVKGEKSQRMQVTSAMLKNGGRLAQKFGAASFLYCFCAILSEKARGSDDEFNTIIGGAAAGTLYSLPGVFNVKKYGAQGHEEEAVGYLRKYVRRLPPAGRMLFAMGLGATFGGLISLYRSQTTDIVKSVTSRG